MLVACVAVGGVLAATGAAEPAAHSAATLAGGVKKALRLGKHANKKATRAVAIAHRAEKAAARSGPAGPAGPQGERGAQGVAGANGAAGTNGSNGAVGPTGATGTTGPRGTTGLWAVVEATGSAAIGVRGTATGAGRLGSGDLYVSFAQDVRPCAYVATVGSTTDQTSPALYATVEQRSGFPNDVRLRSFDDAGTPSDPGSGSGIHLAVLCP